MRIIIPNVIFQFNKAQALGFNTECTESFIKGTLSQKKAIANEIISIINIQRKLPFLSILNLIEWSF